MQKTNSLVKKLSLAFPDFRFELSDDFRWSPEENTVYFIAGSPENLLHETAHAVLGHTSFDKDIELLKIERDAWSYAKKELGTRFGISINDDVIENALDSYRTWLHSRSLCPDCSQSGIQTEDSTYLCLGCDRSWRTNEARRCGLKRYKIEPTKTPAE